MAANAVIGADPAADMKLTKSKSTNKVDGVVAAIMRPDWAIRKEGDSGDIYEEREMIVF